MVVKTHNTYEPKLVNTKPKRIWQYGKEFKITAVKLS